MSGDNLRNVSFLVFGLVACIALFHAVPPVFWRFNFDQTHQSRSWTSGSRTIPTADPHAPIASTTPPPPVVEAPLPAVDPRTGLYPERVKKLAQKGYLLITWTSITYLDFAINWADHVKAAGITGYLVGCMDDQIQAALTARDINIFTMTNGIATQNFGRDGRDFAKLMANNIRLLPIFLELGVKVIISDVDVAWLRSPLPFFMRYPLADILASSDHLSSTVQGEALETLDAAVSNANIGISLFKPSSLPLVEEWIKLLDDHETLMAQDAFNTLFKRNVKALDNDAQGIFQADNGRIRMGLLPVSTFMNGHTYFVQRMHKRLDLKPYAVHATYQFSGSTGKRHRFREALLWTDGPDYYNHSVGFVTFKNTIRGSVLAHSGPQTGLPDLDNVRGHFKLANLQLARVRGALAVAQVLGRALVMPDLWCGVDRGWVPHAGTSPGSNFKLPFKCPMDHMLNLEGGWTRNLPHDEYGPHIQFREHSFFRNPNVPRSVHESKITVHICPRGDSDCSDGSSPATLKDGVVRIQVGLSSKKLRRALREVASSKWLAFSSMDSVFGGHSDHKEAARFMKRMTLYGSLWCCVEKETGFLDKNEGRVHYDLLWNRPHTDRFNRQWTEWNITTGP